MSTAAWADDVRTWSDASRTWAYPGVTDLTATFEWSPSTSPGDAPVWVDFTESVRSGRISRGRQSEFDRTSAGRLSLVVDNRDRGFDPAYSAQARVNKRVRVSVGSSPDVTRLFDGWIDAFPQAYDPPNDATVNITATDGFKLLSRFKLDAIYDPVIEADAPVGWWRLSDNPARSTVLVDSSGNGNDGFWVGLPDTTTGLLPASSNKAIKFDGEGDIGVVEGANLTTGPLSVECWIRTAKYGTNVATLVTQAQIVVGGFSPEPAWHLMLNNDTGYAKFRVHSDGSSYNSEKSVDLSDGEPHHVVGTFGSDRIVRIYIDGVVASSVSSVAPTLTINGSGKIRIGAPAMVKGEGASVGFVDYEGDMGEVAMYDYALSAAEVLAHYNAGAAPWANDTTGVRVGRILTQVGWRTGERDIETGASVLGPATESVEGSTALEHLLKVEETEQGRFFIAGDGTASFFSRNHETPGAAVASFDEADYVDLEFDYSETNLVNDMTVTREGGLPQRAVDQSSIDDYWRVSDTMSGLLYSTDSEARAMAEWRVGNQSVPTLRPSRLTFWPLADLPDLFPRVLTRELGDRVSVTRQLEGVDVDIDAVIEGIEHQFTPREWATSWNLSPLNYGTFGPGGGIGKKTWTLSAASSSTEIKALSMLDNDNLLGF